MLLSEDLTFTGIKPVVISEIRSLAARYGIKRILLFGSRARGDYRRGRGIDLSLSGGGIGRIAALGAQRARRGGIEVVFPGDAGFVGTSL